MTDIHFFLSLIFFKHDVLKKKIFLFYSKGMLSEIIIIVSYLTKINRSEKVESKIDKGYTINKMMEQAVLYRSSIGKYK